MDEKSQLKDSLRRVAADAAEAAAYLRELGVEGLEGVAGLSDEPLARAADAPRAGATARPDAPPPSASPALTRHANAERAAPSSSRLPPTPPSSTSSPLPPTP